MIVSQNRGPQYRSQYTIVLMIGTPPKGAPNFGKPCSSLQFLYPQNPKVKTLESDAIAMREIVDRHFGDVWVIAYALGYWAVVKELSLSYYIGEAILTTIYIYIYIPTLVS